MPERYLVTGVQLGMLEVMDSIDRHKLIEDSIVEKQFVGNSNRSIEDDVKIVSKVIEG